MEESIYKRYFKLLVVNFTLYFDEIAIFFIKFDIFAAKNSHYDLFSSN